MGLAIQGGRLIDPANNVDGRKDILISDDGFVVAVGKKPDNFKIASIFVACFR